MIGWIAKHTQRLSLRRMLQYQTTLRLRECCQHAKSAISECSIPLHLFTTLHKRSYISGQCYQAAVRIPCSAKNVLFFFFMCRKTLPEKQEQFCYSYAQFRRIFAGQRQKRISLFFCRSKIIKSKKNLKHWRRYDWTTRNNVRTRIIIRASWNKLTYYKPRLHLNNSYLMMASLWQFCLSNPKRKTGRSVHFIFLEKV